MVLLNALPGEALATGSQIPTKDSEVNAMENKEEKCVNKRR
jgi:hypothetical protein